MVDKGTERTAALIAELQQTNSTLRALINTIPAGVLVCDAQGAITLANPSANTILGGRVTGTAYGPSGGYTVWRLDGSPFPASDLPLPRAIEHGETTQDVEVLIRYLDGTERVILAAGSPVRDEQGKLTGAVAIFQDITDRKRLEHDRARALSQLRERIKELTALHHAATVFQAEERTVSESLIELVNELPRAWSYPEVAAARITLEGQEIATANYAPSPWTQRTSFETRDGRKGALEVVYLAERPLAAEGPFLAEEREALESLADMLVSYLDRKQTEEQLAAEQRWLRTVVENSPVGIILVEGARGERVAVNRRAEEIFGRPIDPQKGITQFMGYILNVNGTPLARADLTAIRALSGEVVIGCEQRILRSDGREVPIVVNAGPIRDQDGKIIGAAVIVDDITAIKELERLREEWTSVIAHDLRQPLTVITGQASLLARKTKETAPPPEPRVEHILSAARQLNRMISDLLDVSRIEARRLALRRQPMDLPALLEAVVERTVELTKGHPVQVGIRGEVPCVNADAVRIEQVLVNLLSNAAKYGYPGTEIRIEIAARNDQVLVSVINRGAGIPREDLPKLFTRFHRTRWAREERIAGLGLGLYITRGLVEAHGGRIWAESIPGQTTTFSFTLPIAAGRQGET